MSEKFHLDNTLSAKQNEPHSTKVLARDIFCIFGTQKFPSLKICLNKFASTKSGLCNINLTLIIQHNRRNLEFPDILQKKS